MKMCYTNRAVAPSKYVTAGKKESRKLCKMRKNGNFGQHLSGDRIFSVVKDLSTSCTGVMQPSLSVPMYKTVFEKRNNCIFHRLKDRKILE